MQIIYLRLKYLDGYNIYIVKYLKYAEYQVRL